MIIGITGTYRAGKGSVANYLVESKGFRHYSVGKFIEEYIVKGGGTKIDRDALIAAGNEIREKYGADYIVRQLFQRAQKEGGNIIIESIRNPKEAEFIKSQKDGVLFAVDADPLLRYDRAMKKRGLKDRVTIQEFLAQELREFSSTNPNEQNLGRCIELSDYKIINNSSIQDLRIEVDRTIAHILFSGKERGH